METRKNPIVKVSPLVNKVSMGKWTPMPLPIFLYYGSLVRATTMIAFVVYSLESHVRLSNPGRSENH